MAKIVLVQPSLRKESNTAIVIEAVKAEIESRGHEPVMMDLREMELQFCDGRSIGEYNGYMQKAYKAFEDCDAVVIGMPVYCWSISGVLKNFIDIMSYSMKGKVAGLCINAGSPFAYLASSEMMKVLSFESDVTTVQPIVKTSSADFADGKLASDKPKEKIDQMLDKLLKAI